jgi:hypothetical protein
MQAIYPLVGQIADSRRAGYERSELRFRTHGSAGARALHDMARTGLELRPRRPPREDLEGQARPPAGASNVLRLALRRRLTASRMPDILPTCLARPYRRRLHPNRPLLVLSEYLRRLILGHDSTRETRGRAGNCHLPEPDFGPTTRSKEEVVPIVRVARIPAGAGRPQRDRVHRRWRPSWRISERC